MSRSILLQIPTAPSESVAQVPLQAAPIVPTVDEDFQPFVFESDFVDSELPEKGPIVKPTETSSCLLQ